MQQLLTILSANSRSFQLHSREAFSIGIPTLGGIFSLLSLIVSAKYSAAIHRHSISKRRPVASWHPRAHFYPRALFRAPRRVFQNDRQYNFPSNVEPSRPRLFMPEYYVGTRPRSLRSANTKFPPTFVKRFSFLTVGGRFVIVFQPTTPRFILRFHDGSRR